MVQNNIYEMPFLPALPWAFFFSVRNPTLAHHGRFLWFAELEKFSHGFTKTREMGKWK